MNKQVLHLVRKQGVPALAYPASAVSCLWSCSLKMMYVELGRKLTVSLESDVPIKGVDDKQQITLRFEGHSLVPSKGSLGVVSNTLVLTPEICTRLARQGSPQLCMLSLVSTTPCAVWHPRALSDGAFSIDKLPHELSELARTTQVCIVFDRQSLQPDNLSHLRSAVEGPQQCASIPVVPSSQLAQSHKQALRSKVAGSFESETDAAPPPIEDAQDDAPPAYEDAKEQSKRRHGKSCGLVSRGYY
jgi:hypothetical protein